MSGESLANADDTVPAATSSLGMGLAGWPDFPAPDDQNETLYQPGGGKRRESVSSGKRVRAPQGTRTSLRAEATTKSAGDVEQNLQSSQTHVPLDQGFVKQPNTVDSVLAAAPDKKTQKVAKRTTGRHKQWQAATTQTAYRPKAINKTKPDSPFNDPAVNDGTLHPHRGKQQDACAKDRANTDLGHKLSLTQDASILTDRLSTNELDTKPQVSHREKRDFVKNPSLDVVNRHEKKRGPLDTHTNHSVRDRKQLYVSIDRDLTGRLIEARDTHPNDSVDSQALAVMFKDTLSQPPKAHSSMHQGMAYIPPQIKNTPQYLETMKQFVGDKEFLRKRGFFMEKLPLSELEGKRRCLHCGMTAKKIMKSNQNRGSKQDQTMETAINCVRDGETDEAKVAKTGTEKSEGAEVVPNVNRFRCRFHIGSCVNRVWECCGAPSGRFQPPSPCCGSDTHELPQYDVIQLANAHQLHETPENPKALIAVAIDCEMGTAKSGDSELIRISVVDYFSGRLVIDSLVYPDVPMEHLNTKYSGVTFKQLNNAKRQGNVLNGTRGARDALFQLVGSQTIVIGHSVNNDLNSLKWIHLNIIDTFHLEPEPPSEIEARRLEKEERLKRKRLQEPGTTQDPIMSPLEPKAELASESTKQPQPRKVLKPKGAGKRSLKALAKIKLGRDIQVGSKGHDSAEDALASRDLCHWTVVNGKKGIEEILKEQEKRKEETEDLIDLSGA